MLFSALFALSCWSLVLPSLSVAKPLPLAGRDVTKDAPYTVPVSTLSSAIECPSSTPIGDAPGGVVLLVHGTGSTGEESWGSTPYASLLPQLSPGFDICWITLPGRSQGDIQVSAEYVAYNVAPLASKSKTGTISVIGHSQGNLDIQWALNFWPSTRPLVKSFTSLAGDFNGTDEGPFLCSIGNLTSTGCTPATIQQSTTRLTGGGPSAFLAALHTFGGKALVKTTSLFTRYDDVIQSEQEPYPTSRLPGADSIALQDEGICGPAHLAEHFTMLVDTAAFALAYDALTHDEGDATSRFDKQFCFHYVNETLVEGDLQLFAKTPDVVKSIVLDVSSFETEPQQKTEPALMSYVCESGSAENCG